MTHQHIHTTQRKQNEVCNSWSLFWWGFVPLPSVKRNAQQQIHPTRNGSKKWPLDQEVVHPLQVSLLVQSLGSVSYHQNGEKNSSHRLQSQGGVLCRKLRVGFCSTKTWKDGKGWVNWKVWEMGMCYSLFFADEIHLLLVNMKTIWIDWVIPTYEKTISNHQNGQSNSKPGRGGTYYKWSICSGENVENQVDFGFSVKLVSLESIPLEKVVPLLCYIWLTEEFQNGKFQPIWTKNKKNHTHLAYPST